MFHRVIGNFVVQGGGYDPKYVEKPTRAGVPNESGNGLSNRRGTVGLARTGEPHSGTAQFYVNLADNAALDPQPSRWGYTVFGRVVEGMNVVDDIGAVATGSRRPVRARRAAAAHRHQASRSIEMSRGREPRRRCSFPTCTWTASGRTSRRNSSISSSARRGRRRRCTSSATCSKRGSATTIPTRTSAASIAALRSLTQSGVPVYFIHGNRDFLIGRRFAAETGVTAARGSAR